MEQYDFAVLNQDETIAMIPLLVEGPGSVWRRVLELSEIYPPGCRIRVTEQSGEMIMLVGVVTARQAQLLG
jgi:hypothetical protein